METEDIQDVLCMEIPEMGEGEEPTKLSVVQFMLYRVGKPQIENKFKERLKQLKLDHKAIASVSFSVEGNEEASASELARQMT